MNIRQRAACETLRFVPVKLLARLAGSSLIIPYYHMISDQEVLHVRNLYPYKGERGFIQDLEFLLKRFRPLSLSEVMEFAGGSRALRGQNFLLTFDDGFREMADVVAPILLRKGVPAVFFVGSAFIDNKRLCYDHKKSLILERLKRGVPPGTSRRIKQILGLEPEADSVAASVLAVDYAHSAALDRIAEILFLDFDEYLKKNSPYLSSESIRSLVEAGFAIGGHSVDHPLYALLPLEEQVRQTEESVRHIKESYGLSYGAFAFPHGDTGVRAAFFSRIREGGLVDVSFGTGGLIRESTDRHFQRVTFEKPLLDANQLLRLAVARRMYRDLRGKGVMKRDA